MISLHFQLIVQLLAMSFVVDTAVLSINKFLQPSMPGGGVLSGKVGTGMCGPDGVHF